MSATPPTAKLNAKAAVAAHITRPCKVAAPGQADREIFPGKSGSRAIAVFEALRYREFKQSVGCTETTHSG